jgi:enamine deaminase RidA (YjgF/YER057c/UK114 family)
MFSADFLKNRTTLLVVFAAILLQVGLAGAQKNASPSKPNFDTYHAGPWEQTIGYSQAVRNGNMLYVSGTVGADEKGLPADLDGQMKRAYAGIQKTLVHYNTDFSHVVMERIYTTDIEALIRSQDTRKQFYGSSAPAATWVEVKRLYGAADKIEIEVQVALD